MSMAAALAAFAGVLSLALLAFLWWVVRRIRRLQSPSTLAPLAPVPCPRCAARMTPGRVINGRGLIWLPAGHKPRLLANALWNSLPNTLSAGFRFGRNPAQRCERCMIVLIDHSRADY